MNLYFLDFETTGLNVYHNDVIEIGIKKYGIDDYYQSFVIPKVLPKGLVKYVPPNITKITGINDEIIEKKGILKSIAVLRMYQYIEKTCDRDNPIYIIAHNGNSFDFIIFRKLLHYYQSRVIDNLDKSIIERFQYIDTVLLAKYLFPNEKVNQNAICTKYNIVNENAHRAFDDVKALEQIYIKMCSTLDNYEEKEDYYIHNPDQINDKLFV